MKILAIDTSGKSAGVAILDNDSLVQEVTVQRDIHHSEVLLPVLDQLCRDTGLSVHDMDLYACTTGPGSFTGLRIGLSTIKGLALVTGKPIAGISTLEALAFNAAGTPYNLCPMLDARKDQVYAALYRQGPDGRMQCLRPDGLADVTAFLQGVTGDTVFLGDGAVRYRREIEALFPDRSVFAQPFHNHVRAAVVGIIGYEKYRAGEAMETALTLMPKYLRLSEAEEKSRLANASRADRY